MYVVECRISEEPVRAANPADVCTTEIGRSAKSYPYETIEPLGYVIVLRFPFASYVYVCLYGAPLIVCASCAKSPRRSYENAVDPVGSLMDVKRPIPYALLGASYP